MEANNANMNQINQGPAPLAQISAKEFAANYQSKRECYIFVALECDRYVPKYGKSQRILRLIPLCVQTTSRSTSSRILSAARRRP